MKTIAVFTLLAGLMLAASVQDASAQGWGRGRGGCGGYGPANCPVYQGSSQPGNATAGPACPWWGQGSRWSQSQGAPGQAPSTNTPKQ